MPAQTVRKNFGPRYLCLEAVYHLFVNSWKWIGLFSSKLSYSPFLIPFTSSLFIVWWWCSVVSDSLLPVDCNPPGSSVRGSFQARILEWVAIAYFRGSSRPRDWTHISFISYIGRQILYHCTTWEAPFYSIVISEITQKNQLLGLFYFQA